MTRYKLIVPLKRSPHPPEYTALGCAVGLGLAMTPLVGVQIPLTLLTWFVMRTLNKNWDFNVIVAMAWTWVSNVFTMAPLYYVFYLTGQAMLFRWDDLSGYGAFIALWNDVLVRDSGFWHQVANALAFLVEQQGFAMAVGCLPWAAVAVWQGYVQSLRYLKSRRDKLKARRALGSARAE